MKNTDGSTKFIAAKTNKLKNYETCGFKVQSRCSGARTEGGSRGVSPVFFVAINYPVTVRGVSPGIYTTSYHSKRYLES